MSNYKENLDDRNVLLTLKVLYTTFVLNTTTRMAFLLDIFTYPSNKCVIYRPELNLYNRELLVIAYILKFTLVTLFDK